VDSRGCKSLDEFSSEDQEDSEDEDYSVIIEEDESDVDGDLFL